MKPEAAVRFAVNVNQFTHLDDFPGMIEFVTTAEREGYDKVRFIDHVVGAEVARHPTMAYTPYTHDSNFNEVFTLLAYLSAITSRIKLVTGVLVLPQRQTALVAKQAAQVDVLSGGRYIMGAGIGYNHVEFEALESNFKQRARRFEEQIDVLRMLWTQDLVSFEGDFHRLDHVNIRPRPVQRPIPIWIGAGRTNDPVPIDRVLDRIGRKADGWCPLFRIATGADRLDAAALEAIAKVADAARTAGRDPARIDMELGLFPDGKSRAHVLEEIAALYETGARHIHVRFSGASARDQIDSLKRFMDLVH